MGIGCSKEKGNSVDPSLLVPRAAISWPNKDLKRAILGHMLAPFYPPLPEASEDDVVHYSCSICYCTYFGPLNRCFTCNNYICTECFCNIVPFEQWTGKNCHNPGRCPFCKVQNWQVRVIPKTSEEIKKLLEEREQVEALQLRLKQREYEENKANELHAKRDNQAIVDKENSVLQRLPTRIQDNIREYIPENILGGCSDLALIELRMMELAFAESISGSNQLISGIEHEVIQHTHQDSISAPPPFTRNASQEQLSEGVSSLSSFSDCQDIGSSLDESNLESSGEVSFSQRGAKETLDHHNCSTLNLRRVLSEPSLPSLKGTFSTSYHQKFLEEMKKWI